MLVVAEPGGSPDDNAEEGTDVYRYAVYRSGFAKTKGPAVCAHGTALATNNSQSL